MSFLSDILNNIGFWFADNIHRNLIIENRWLLLLKGLGVTLEITLIAITIGTLLGAVLALMRISKAKFISSLAGLYIGVIRGTPTVVQLLIIYFGVFGSVDLNKVIIASIAFGLNSAAYVAEIFRAGILSVDHGQMEAARCLGLNYRQAMVRIILPQAIKNILPTYTSEFIVLIKETAIVGYIALNDLTKVGDYIRSRTFSPFFPLLVAAALYLLLTTILTKLFANLERRLRKSDIR